MTIEVTQCSMCKHYSEEQYCEIWQQYIANDAFYCACGAKADRKTENSSEKPNNSTISKMEQVDESQTNADQHVQHIESVETMSCQECRRWIYDDRWGWFCPLKSQDECKYEPKTEPQTDCAWK